MPKLPHELTSRWIGQQRGDPQGAVEETAGLITVTATTSWLSTRVGCTLRTDTPQSVAIRWPTSAGVSASALLATSANANARSRWRFIPPAP